MRHQLIISFCVLICFSACFRDKNKESSIPDQLVGEWTLVRVVGIDVDEVTKITFHKDGNVYAENLPLLDQNTHKVTYLSSLGKWSIQNALQLNEDVWTDIILIFPNNNNAHRLHFIYEDKQLLEEIDPDYPIQFWYEK